MPSVARSVTSSSETSTIAMPLMGRLVVLDSLRFVAASAVFLQHSLEKRSELGGEFVSLLSPGVFGVALFFIISGFIIPMTAGKEFNLKKFIIRRVFRIYPLVLVSFVLVAIIGNVTNIVGFADVKTVGVLGWLANIFLVQDYFGYPAVLGVTWTLSIEFFWYGLFAISFIFLGHNFDRWLVIAAPVGMFALIVASLILDRRLPFGRIGMIYLAIIGCRIYSFYTGRISVRRILLDSIVFFTVTIAANSISFGYFHHPRITMMQAVLPWTIASFLFMFVFMIPQVRDSQTLNSPLLGWLGSISFSTYLLHPIALEFAATYAPNGTEFIAATVGTFLLAALGYHLVEAPGQAIGRRLTRKDVNAENLATHF